MKKLNEIERKQKGNEKKIRHLIPAEVSDCYRMIHPANAEGTLESRLFFAAADERHQSTAYCVMVGHVT